jgi:hypothetical protein
LACRSAAATIGETKVVDPATDAEIGVADKTVVEWDIASGAGPRSFLFVLATEVTTLGVTLVIAPETALEAITPVAMELESALGTVTANERAISSGVGPRSLRFLGAVLVVTASNFRGRPRFFWTPPISFGTPLVADV